MKNIFQKSAMALAVASLSVSAFAGDWLGSADEIVLANEVFGAGSEATLVAIPATSFNLVATKGNLVYDADPAVNETATIKFTLNEDAVFGEDLSSIDKWQAAGVTLVIRTTDGDVAIGNTAAPDFASTNLASVTVDQGGAIGDNTVTFLITPSANTTIQGVDIAQVRVKGLTSALARGIENPTVRLGAEYRNVKTTETDTQAARVIFRSQDGVELTGVLTDYSNGATGLRSRINVASTEQLFTSDLGESAAKDFDGGDDLRFVNLGTLRVNRTDSKGADGVSLNTLVKKENGDDFDFNGSDNITITLASNVNLDAFSHVYLAQDSVTSSGPTACSFAANGAYGSFSKTPAAGAESVVIDLSGQTTDQLAAGYRVCAVAKGNVAIPEQSFSATLNVEYFNPRYTDSVDTLEYGAILRNGCSVTLFNLPTTSVGDDAYIRLTNVSEIDGAVRAFVWTEDGERIDAGSELTGSLTAHSTVVLHTNEGQGNGVFLGDVLPEYSELTSGRHRIVLQGAFPACEAMGLIRTPAGVLVNMTSTTYSGDQSRLGEFNNGTSNTTN